MRFFTLFLFVFSALVFPVRAQEFDHAGLANEVLERHIVPSYERFADAAGRLEGAVQTFCNDNAAQDITAVQSAFADALLAWYRVEHIRFGPIMDEQRHARLVYWPDRKGLGRKQVARALRKSDRSVLTQDSLAKKSVALQGFGALEYILYSKGNTALLKQGKPRQFRCGYMRAIAGNMRSISEEVLSEWTSPTGYRETFLKPGDSNPAYLEWGEVTLEIAKSFLVGFDRLRDVRIAGALGLQPNSSRRKPSAFDRSGLSTRVLQANLEGLDHLYNEGGLKSRIEQVETGMGTALQNDFDIALKELGEITVPMKQAVEDEETEDRLIGVGFPLKTIRGETERILAQAAGLSIGFNALDGD